MKDERSDAFLEESHLALAGRVREFGEKFLRVGTEDERDPAQEFKQLHFSSSTSRTG